MKHLMPIIGCLLLCIAPVVRGQDGPEAASAAQDATGGLDCRDGYSHPDDLQARRRLDRVVHQCDMSAVPLDEVLYFMRSVSGCRLDASWEQLTQIGIGPETPVSMSVSGAPVHAILDAICLLLTSNEPMAWYIADGRVILTRQQYAARHTAPRVHARPRQVPLSMLATLLPGPTAWQDEPAGLRLVSHPQSHALMRQLLRFEAETMLPADWDGMLAAIRPLHQTRMNFHLDARPVGPSIQELARALGVTAILDQNGAAEAEIDLQAQVSASGENVTALEAIRMILDAADPNGALVADPVPGSRTLIITTRARARRHLAVFSVSPELAQRMQIDESSSRITFDPAFVAQLPDGDWILDPVASLCALDSGGRVLAVQTLDRLLALGQALGDATPTRALERTPRPEPPPEIPVYEIPRGEGRGWGRWRRAR